MPASTTLHALSGTRYVGAFENARVVDASDVEAHGLELRGDPAGFVVVIGDRSRYVTRTEDLFPTEEAARAAARARRAPRRPRRQVALYGDFAQLAALNGIRTDGSGRRAR